MSNAEANDAFAAAEAARPWISVADRLPENHDDALVFSTDAGMVIAAWFRDDEIWYCDAWEEAIDEVTHWLPLPPPPIAPPGRNPPRRAA